MNKNFIPDKLIQSFDQLNILDLKEKKIDTILLDIDNTLVGYRCALPTPEVKLWIDKLKKEGFKIAIVSNAKKNRAENFCKDLNIVYIHRAGKPAGTGINKALGLLDSRPTGTVFIGDQIFTDIFGANRLGIYSVLVKPISKDESIYCKFKRVLEKRVHKKINNKKSASYKSKQITD